MEQSKKCSKCGEVKNVADFSFRDSTKTNTRGACKSCEKARQANAYRERLKRPHIATPTATKTCRDCRQDKAASEFFANRRNRDGLGSYCKPCNSARADGWRKANPERAAQVAAAKQLRNRGNEKLREYQRAKAKEYASTERGKLQRASNQRRYIAELRDAYVRATLAQSGGILARDMPDSLVQAKREQLVLRRLERELRTHISNQQENQYGD